MYAIALKVISPYTTFEERKKLLFPILIIIFLLLVVLLIMYLIFNNRDRTPNRVDELVVVRERI